MARAVVWTSVAALVAAGVLVRRKDFLLSLSLYLGARDVAALPLRPTDVFRLEVSAAAGDCKSGGNGDCRGVVKTVATAQYPVASKKAGLDWELGTSD